MTEKTHQADIDAGALISAGLAEAEKKIREAADQSRRGHQMVAEAESQSVYWRGRADSYRNLLRAAEAQSSTGSPTQPAAQPAQPAAVPAQVKRGRRSSKPQDAEEPK